MQPPDFQIFLPVAPKYSNPLSTRPHWYNNSWLGFLKILNYVPKEREKYTVEPRYNEDLGTMKITSSVKYQVSHYIWVKKQGNTKSWDQQKLPFYITGFCYVSLYCKKTSRHLSQLNAAMSHRNYFKQNNLRIHKLATYNTKLEDHYFRCKLASF